MTFNPTSKNPGDLIRSADWNDAIDEVVRLEDAKVDRTGDAISGDLTVGNTLGVGVSSVEDGAVLDLNGPLHFADTASKATLMFYRGTESGTPSGDDGFRMRWDTGFFGTDLDALVIEKTDFNHNDPDGGIAFVNTGKDGNVETALAIRGDGDVGIGTPNPRARLEVVGGAIMPAAGNSEQAGILFPKDPGGGSGDAAWIRYYPRTGEATTLEIGTSNDNTDHIALMATGNVGIGIVNPADTLDVDGDLRVRGENIKDEGGMPRITLTDDGKLHLKKDNGAVALTIDTDGRVGVGTATPDSSNSYSKLHICGSTVPNKNVAHHAGVIYERDEATLQIIGKDRGSHLADIVLTGAPNTGDNKHWILSHQGPTRSNRLSIGYMTGELSDTAQIELPEFLTIWTNGTTSVSSLIVNNQTVSPGAKNVKVMTGTVFNNGIVPLPADFTAAQCKWLVSPRYYYPPKFDINENGPNAQFSVECSVSIDRRVTCRWRQRGHSSTPGFKYHNGAANYIVIGVK